MSAVLRDFTLDDYDGLYGDLDGSETASLDDIAALLSVEDGFSSADACADRRARIPGAEAVGLVSADSCDDRLAFIMEAIGGELVSDECAVDTWRDRRFADCSEEFVTDEGVTFILAGWQWSPTDRSEGIWTPIEPADAQGWIQVPSLSQTRNEEFG